jgi:bacterioferritin
MTAEHSTIEMLTDSYMMEMETITNYLANSVYLDGVHAEEIKRSLAEDVAEEMGHAQRLAERIKQLGGRIPGSLELEFSQQSLQPPAKTTDVEAVVQGVIDAEAAAIAQYRQIIDMTDGFDFVTQDLAIQIMADEQKHFRQFEGFRAGFQAASSSAR